MIERGYIGRALQIIANDPVTYFAGGAILQVLNWAVAGLLTGPAICGIVWITLRRLRGQDVEFGDIFRGFEDFGHTFLAGLVFTLLLAAGLALFIVPGIILGALFAFVFPFVVDRRMPFAAAMTASRTLGAGSADLLDRSLFFLSVFLIAVSGIILCVVGVFFTWPVMWAAIAVAYEEMAPPAGSPVSSDPLDE